MASPPESLLGLSRPPKRGGRAAFASSPMAPTSRCCSRAYGMGWFDYERARVDDRNNLFGMFLDRNQKTLDQTCEMTAMRIVTCCAYIELLRANPAAIPAEYR